MDASKSSSSKSPEGADQSGDMGIDVLTKDRERETIEERLAKIVQQIAKCLETPRMSTPEKLLKIIGERATLENRLGELRR